MRYKPKGPAALQIALGGLPDQMKVEVEPGIGVTAKTVSELRQAAICPGNLAIATPQQLDPAGHSEGGKSCYARYTETVVPGGT